MRVNFLLVPDKEQILQCQTNEIPKTGDFINLTNDRVYQVIAISRHYLHPDDYIQYYSIYTRTHNDYDESHINIFVKRAKEKFYKTLEVREQ